MKKKIELEYTFRSSTKILFNRLSTASGLSEWFADNVTIKGDVYIFVWEGIEQRAKLLKSKDCEYIQFQWEDEDEDYFEFRISEDDVTGESALILTDFVEPDEEIDAIELWDAQINELKHVLGA
ncbi:MAG: SRPBCC domain-containing protein [Bacteroidales bacterium]|nr:SRPBCC domain-containing protein [Bacteroidales bacterium]